MQLRRHLLSASTVLLAAWAALLLGSPALRAEPVAQPGSGDHGPLARADAADEAGEWAEGAVGIEGFDSPDAALEAELPAPAAGPAGTPTPIPPVVSDLLRHQAEQDRRAQLTQAYLHRPPTWIQDAATVNLGDFPTLHDPTADTERTLQTLEWVLREQARQAASRPATAEGDSTPATGWRLLLPGHWLPVLKANRELVISAGGGLLLLAWAISAFPRRHAGARRKAPRPEAADPASAKPRRRRRRRTHLLEDASHRHGRSGQHGHHRHAELARSSTRH